MGVLDKFLDILKLSDEDEDYDEEFFDDEEYDDIEEKPKRNFFKKKSRWKKMKNNTMFQKRSIASMQNQQAAK